MNKILDFLMKYCSYLYEEYDFRFTDSLCDNSGNASITLSSSNVNIRICTERGQMVLAFQSNHYGKKDVYSWYSIDIVRELMTGDKKCTTLMDKANIDFLKNNIVALLDSFSPTEAEKTIAKLKKLERIRSKDLG